MIRSTAPFLKRFVLYNKYVRSIFCPTRTQERIVVNSVPKAGTHLVMKALELFPGIWRSPIQFGRQRLALLPWCLFWCPSLRPAILSQYRAHQNPMNAKHSPGIPIDSDSPFLMPAENVQEIFDLIQPGWFVMGHLPFSDDLNQLMLRGRLKMILILRDPRDVVVSHANYIATKPSHYLFRYYQSLTFEKQIMTSIAGVSEGSHHPRLLSIKDRLISTLPWMGIPYTYTTYFEKLVGREGDGSRAKQLKELRAIAETVGIPYSESELEKVASSLYGGTRTFRKGTTGRWRTVFSQDHRTVTKDLIGDLLVELGYEDDLDW